MQTTETVQNRMDYKDFEPLFGDWAEKFKPFIESEDMFKIYKRIKEDAQKETICPNSTDVFRAFSTTNPNRVKVVFSLLDPYPRKYKENGKKQATGIAMDCSNSPDGRLQPSLEKFYEAIERELKIKIERSPSLEYLHEQGVMMTNTDLTCKMNKTGSHSRLWDPFQKYFLETVMGSKAGTIYVLCGKEAHRLDRYIFPIGNHIFKVEHPSAAARDERAWNTDGLFTKINKIFTEQGNGLIFWDKKAWDEELPF